ncbi:hypothetical protein DENSPDRAFT_500300 [Dentipellis sp. KUC8613]|nr:hypothetical protein DENSPDRAFT_500300 [Dentipellis sp. KUC8613]
MQGVTYTKRDAAIYSEVLIVSFRARIQVRVGSADTSIERRYLQLSRAGSELAMELAVNARLSLLLQRLLYTRDRQEPTATCNGRSAANWGMRASCVVDMVCIARRIRTYGINTSTSCLGPNQVTPMRSRGGVVRHRACMRNRAVPSEYSG